MMARNSLVVLLLGISATLGGCATADIVPMGSDSYMISQTSAGGMFTNMGALKAEVIKRANAFAEKHSKVAVPIASRETPPAPGRMPNFEYQFRLVDANDPRAPGGGLIPRADMVIENNVHPTPDLMATKSAEKEDVYTELLKLDDLRKRGRKSSASNAYIGMAANLGGIHFPHGAIVWTPV